MTPKKFNKAMGAVIRTEMKARNMTMEKLGKKIGVSYQQIGKFCAGQNSLSAYQLNQVAGALGLSVADFYERASISVPSPAEPTAIDNDTFLVSRYLRKIRSACVRQAVVQFTRKLAYEGAR